MIGQMNLAETLGEYAGPIFGFALNRVKNREEAEDLAQEIMLQLFRSVSSGAEIQHLEGYIWTVARYTWVHWLKKRAHAPKSIEYNGISERLYDPDSTPLDLLLENEAYRTLRREIAFLSSIHRRIVVMYYYDGLKQSEIANALGLSVGTVKWHLHDARQELKKGMERVSETGMLSMKPIRLTGTGHAGSPGARGETSDFLGRALAQNIVYAAYRKPKSVQEIAEAMGTPPAFLEEEIRFLAEYAYLTEVSPGKFQSNTIIWDRNQELLEETHRLYQSCAAELADVHFEALMDVRKQVEESGIYYPEEDYNFLLWTMLPKNIDEQAMRSQNFSYDLDKVAPMRIDGGQYIAFANLEKEGPDSLSFDMRYYLSCGDMIREKPGSPLYLWQLNTYWSDRPLDWRYVNFRDVEVCDVFWRGELTDTDANRDEYAFLLKQEYIRKTDSGYQLNVVWVNSTESLHKWDAAMPDVYSAYGPVISNLYTRLMEMMMRHQPRHLEPQITYMVKGNSCGGTLVTYILKHLVDSGKLKLPLPHQRKTITTWMGPVKS